MDPKDYDVSRWVNALAISPQEALNKISYIENCLSELGGTQSQGLRRFDFKKFLDQLSSQDNQEAGIEQKRRQYNLDLIRVCAGQLAWYIGKISEKTDQYYAFRALEILILFGYSLEYDDRINDPLYRRYILANQSKSARQERAQKAGETILLECIRLELGSTPIERPYKIAVAILDAVNKRMRERGEKPVKVDKVARRLVKISAVLKSAEDKSA